MAKFLRNIVSADDCVLSGISFNHLDSDGRLILEINDQNIEMLREFLTEQLAKIGFDKDYSLTECGQVLETLIDIFYVDSR